MRRTVSEVCGYDDVLRIRDGRRLGQHDEATALKWAGRGQGEVQYIHVVGEEREG